MQTAPRLNLIGKYRLIATLGQGGMAKVYLALSAGPAGFNKLLVIKSLRDDLPEGDAFVRMFLEEARLAARLNHPNVVQTYEVGEASGRYFIAMEYLEGQSFRTVQRRLGMRYLPLDTQLRILIEASQGLHHVHELKSFDGQPMGVVHRDVSPQNIFLTYEGQVKLLDFGIAKAPGSTPDTRAGVVKGKVDYMAPEQVRGHCLDRRADVFALGAMLWEMLSGQRFAGGQSFDDVSKMHRRVTGQEAAVRCVAADAPEPLLCLCERSLSLNPAGRPATAEQFAEELRSYLAERSAHPSARQLSRSLEEPFAPTRRQLQEAVEEQVQQCADLPSGSFEPGQTGSLPLLTSPMTRNSTSRIRQRRIPPLPQDAQPSGAHHTGVGSSQDSLAPVSESAMPLAPSSSGPRGLVWVALAVVAVFASLGAAGAWWLRPQLWASPPALTSRPLVQPLAPPSTSAAGSPARLPVAPSRVHLRVQVHPQGARVELDGAELSALPFSAQVDRDDQVHTLRAWAPGHVEQTKVLTFTDDLDLQIRLSPTATDELNARSRRRRRQRDRRRKRAPSVPVLPVAESAGADSPQADKPTELQPGDNLLVPGGAPRLRSVLDSSNPYQ